MIDREKVSRAIAGEVAGVEPGRVRFSWDSVVAFDGGPALDCAALADAAIVSVLEQLREQVEGWPPGYYALGDLLNAAPGSLVRYKPS